MITAKCPPSNSIMTLLSGTSSITPATSRGTDYVTVLSAPMLTKEDTMHASGNALRNRSNPEFMADSSDLLAGKQSAHQVQSERHQRQASPTCYRNQCSLLCHLCVQPNAYIASSTPLRRTAIHSNIRTYQAPCPRHHHPSPQPLGELSWVFRANPARNRELAVEANRNQVRAPSSACSSQRQKRLTHNQWHLVHHKLR